MVLTKPWYVVQFVLTKVSLVLLEAAVRVAVSHRMTEKRYIAQDTLGTLFFETAYASWRAGKCLDLKDFDQEHLPQLDGDVTGRGTYARKVSGEFGDYPDGRLNTSRITLPSPSFPSTRADHQCAQARRNQLCTTMDMDWDALPCLLKARATHQVEVRSSLHRLHGS